MYLETHDVVKQYANHLALNKVSISVPKGTVFGLLGPNGAGKTTLIRIITRITAPDSGDVMIEGRQSVGNDIYNIGYMPEERGLYKKMKVGEQAMYLAQLRGMSKKQAHHELMVWFKRFDIMDWYNRKVEELSKGMQQKVQFISTVIHDPDLLIFDEPFSGFDPVNTDIVKNEMLRLKDEGKTIILSTHNMESVEELCDNIALINKSQVVLQGNVFKIRKDHRPNIFRFRIFGDDFNLEHPSFELLSKEPYHEFIDLRIKKLNGISNNDLAKLIFDNYEVVSYDEELPTMNDVFIKTVTKDKNISTL
ncbi:MAG TPA: ATP-binding cassette domain-containing protein [Fermentimonas caenicola]|mgnify:FL=1|jgi:ABC-2 type transport system ATP-binding protein|uniref:ABC transporter domain-containing protein n=1 Tax=Fermentimonas caenicola TaxID=1562970 RepID=A0A098C3K8_9BACT|nr:MULTISPECIES: ABC transporter ATP-binding protein [Lascolabacillus]MBP6175438.1 ATP-binding cassette domain-containing protein [Fermentimonas sp.]MDI9625315.1 ABC transporter ATP-binding protein [Bacteroidota bacterium]TAH60672.1 MAG: ATP-binding cassette domain-containing protein [Fermentimonas caenicola]MBP6196464.1 ATP-binding cassette domain-containing protein [Fermentimonas sp.]MBP7104734.1 ATP-binding cassette domain-containing protein [Fermentimonas sp.]